MFKKILLWFFLILALAILGFGAWLWVNKEEIESQLIKEVKSYFEVPTEIGSTEIDPFSNFPYISLEANNVYSQGSGEHHDRPLFELEQMSFGVEFWDILNGDLVIKHMLFKGGQINIIHPSKGEPNYLIIKKQEETGEPTSYDSLKGLEIEDITFKDVLLSYSIPDKGVLISTHAEKLKADLLVMSKLIQAGLDFKGTTDKVLVNRVNYVKGQNAGFTGLLNIDLENNRFYFENLKLILDKVPISANMKINWGKETDMDLLTNIGPSDIDLIHPHLPKPVSGIVKDLKAKGKVNGTFAIKGRVDGEHDPGVEIRVPIRDLEIGFFDSLQQMPVIENGEVVFTSTRFFSDSSNRLDITAKKISWGETLLSGEFKIPVIARDHCSLNLKGDLEFESLIRLSKSTLVENPEGQINFNIKYIGPILKENQHVLDGSKISGGASFEDLKLDFVKRNFNAREVRGKFDFNNEILSFTDVSASLGKTDVQINGYAINFLNYFFFEDQDIYVESKILSDTMVLEDLLRSGQDTSDFILDFSPNVSFLVKPEIHDFRFKQFHAKKITGRLKLKDQKLLVRDLNMNLADGNAELEMELNTQDSLNYSWIADFDFDSLKLDSTFYFFDNFGQSFIKSENLRGRLSASGEMYLESNSKLEFDPASIRSTIDTRVYNGKLVNFEPIRNIQKFLDRKTNLDYVEFDELKNDIVVSERRVIIPQMEIRSSAKDALISGFHNFDNSFEYHLQVPVFGKKKRDKDEQYGIVEKASGLSFVLLKIEGNPEDYKVDYDTEELINKVKRGFFLETQEALNLFRRKKKESKVEFEDDEFHEIDQ